MKLWLVVFRTFGDIMVVKGYFSCPYFCKVEYYSFNEKKVKNLKKLTKIVKLPDIFAKSDVNA